MEKYCVIDGQVAIFKFEQDEMLTVEPIKGIDYKFSKGDSVRVTVDGVTYSGVVLSPTSIDCLGWEKADEAIGKVVSFENGDAICKGVVLDVAGDVYVVHQTDDEIVYVNKKEAKLCEQ